MFIHNKTLLYVLSFVFLSSWYTIQSASTNTGVAYIVSAGTISRSGYYYFNNDLVGTITIAADNVTLDMNNKKMTSPSGNGISATGHAAITIKNGIIQNAAGDGILIDTCSVVTISNVDFIGNNTGAYILTSTNVMVEQCNFTAQTAVATPESSIFAGALVIDNSNNCLVQNNELVKNTNCSGILMQNAAHDNILENNICNQNQLGIFLNNGCFNNKIDGNTCSENSAINKGSVGVGIFLSLNCSNNVIENNVCCGNALTENDSSSNFIGGSGIFLNVSCSNNAIKNNTCLDNVITASGSGTITEGGTGIFLDGCLNNSIEYNTCSGNSAVAINNGSAFLVGVGIYVAFGSSNNSIEHNTCSGNSVTASNFGEIQQGGSGIYVYDTCSQNTIQENSCFGNSATRIGGDATVAEDGAGIFVNFTSSTNSIVNNSCNDHIFSAGSTNTGYGIRVQTSDCTTNVIVLNNALGNTAGISDGGSGTVVYNNTIVDANSSIITLY